MATNLRSSLVVTVFALSGVVASATSAGVPLNVKVERGPDGAFVVDAELDVSAPPEAVWQVLTDYEGIHEFVSSIRQSTVKERAPGRALVEQYGVARAWMVSIPIHVILEVQEHARNELTFRDVCGESFTNYEGKWELTPIAGGTRVTYHLQADLTARQPAMLVRSALQGSVKKLLIELRTEMETRAN